MTKDEFVQVMALASALDSRLVVTRESMAAWYAIAGHVPADVAAERVCKHYATSGLSLMPVDLLNGKATPTPQTLPCPPVDPDDVGRYQAWLAAYARALALGNPPDNAEALADAALGVVRRPRHLTARPLALPQMQEIPA